MMTADDYRPLDEDMADGLTAAYAQMFMGMVTP